MKKRLKFQDIKLPGEGFVDISHPTTDAHCPREVRIKFKKRQNWITFRKIGHSKARPDDELDPKTYFYKSVTNMGRPFNVGRNQGIVERNKQNNERRISEVTHQETEKGGKERNPRTESA
ncbi:hypothetical protein E6C27_scaffold46G003530 [Cucumis melo var. makuwa]|uniref:Uncharacterized protein n=1 Tax=Cucumis melo var. makuwa TaxID=1194695 RepID=A0A5A7TMR9_CUCMM|nr:hypothetical protein E6C27_scaffold46G003530 [Cucumis melo var. makuwa]